MVTATKPKPTLDVSGPVDRMEIKALVSLYYDVQRFRVGGNNRRKALEKQLSTSERLAVATAHLKSTEEAIAKLIAPVVKDDPLAEWPMSLRGVGPILAAALIASGLDPAIDKPSAWWRFAGVGVVDGKNQRKRRGEKVNYNMFLNKTLYVLVGSFLKAGDNLYADLYRRFKEESAAGRPDIIPSACKHCDGTGTVDEQECNRCGGKGEVGAAIHHHLRAMMLTERVFLTHLQQRWREALGMPPPRVPYIHAGPDGGLHELIPAP